MELFKVNYFKTFNTFCFKTTINIFFQKNYVFLAFLFDILLYKSKLDKSSIFTMFKKIAFKVEVNFFLITQLTLI